ncbi:hypothetical protein [Flavobacterium cerinum]|uniref:Lipoprotein n=1 Tax=Flavobacterium cerinum TaxID=2502784 RepID=A0A444HCQ3_9FLAO|nr:hypothetical protein [Flavobacterium cerinum]RWX01556.1 hypothetical protein EPI11_06290 [Flavobacterium cerinum]
MKKLVLLSALSIFMFSCDFILKDRKNTEVEVNPNEKVVLGNDKDAQGCVASAGYRWSDLFKECIRVFEEGYRLNSIDELAGESTSKSAFVVFEKEDGDRAELFLPDGSKSIILTRDTKNGAFKNKEWSLQLKSGYSLKKNGELLFAGATIKEDQITGDDKEES